MGMWYTEKSGFACQPEAAAKRLEVNTMLEYKRPLHFAAADFDQNGDIRPGALLHYFQDIAALHADEMGIGYETMIAKDRIWIITKLRYRMEAALRPEKNYVLTTCPRKKRSRICPRDYYIHDEAGGLAVRGTSLWSIINYKTRKLERIPFDYGEDLCEKDAFSDGFQKLHLERPQEAGSYTIQKEDLDINDHTNNCRYADLVKTLCGLDTIREFTIQFSKETRLGDKIFFYRERGEEEETICGQLADKETVLCARLIRS